MQLNECTKKNCLLLRSFPPSLQTDGLVVVVASTTYNGIATNVSLYAHLHNYNDEHTYLNLKLSICLPHYRRQ